MYHFVVSFSQLVHLGECSPPNRSDPFKAFLGIVDKQVKNIDKEVEKANNMGRKMAASACKRAKTES